MSTSGKEAKIRLAMETYHSYFSLMENKNVYFNAMYPRINHLGSFLYVNIQVPTLMSLIPLA
jgi:hypothetical protein